MAIKELQVRSAAPCDKPYKLADGEGLFLLVKPNGAKLWRMKYRSLARKSFCPLVSIPKSACQRRGNCA